MAIFFVFPIVFFIIVASVIISVVKRGHRINDRVESVFEKGLDLAHQKFDEKLNSSKPEICEYCGALIPQGKNECESCGAKKRIK